MELDSGKKKSSHGGRRVNAGCKSGLCHRKTREIAERAMREGVTPLETMLLAMREALAEFEAAKKLVEQARGTTPEELARITSLNHQELEQLAASQLSAAAGYAKDAAPYIHPRLSAIGQAPGIVPLKIEVVNF